MSYSVIPAQAGTQWSLEVCVIAFLDPRFRGDDGYGSREVSSPTSRDRSFGGDS